MSNERKKIIIIGFGWASIGFLNTIDKEKYDITLISDNCNFTFSPLLTDNTIIDKNININQALIKNINFIKNKIDDIDFKNKLVCNKNYDYLIFSHGSEVNTFNVPGVLEHSYPLKTFYDSVIIKNKFKKLPDGSTIAIIGAGLVGTELIGNLIDYKKFKIIAIDALPRPLITFNEQMSNKVLEEWTNSKVNIKMNNFISRINQNDLEIKDKKEKIKFDMAIWCGGIKINPLSPYVNNRLKLNCNKGIPVNNFLQINNYPNLFAIGDCAYSGFPPTAQVAYQQGIYLGKCFNQNHKSINQFNFSNKGQIGYIGNGKSVYQNNYFQGGGKIIGYMNKFIHFYNYSKIYVESKFF